jgi:hypothetical protein
MQQQKGHSTPPIVHTKTRKHRPRSVVGKKKMKKKKGKKLVEQSDLLFGKTATRLPVILKRTIQHRPVLSKLYKLSIISLVAHM